MSNFYEDQVLEILSRRAEQFDSTWLLDFAVTTRPVSGYNTPTGDLKMFNFSPDSELNRENINCLHPNAIQAFAGSSHQSIADHSLEDFARGAATATALLSGQDVDFAADFIKQQLDVMYQRLLSDENPYPFIAENFMVAYASAVTLIALQDEVLNWRGLLGFALGFIWMLGFVKMNPVDEQLVLAVLYDQVRTGTYYV